MVSLKELVGQYGFNIHVASTDSKWVPFTILSEYSDEEYWVRFETNRVGAVLKECPTTNDYFIKENKNG